MSIHYILGRVKENTKFSQNQWNTGDVKVYVKIFG